MAGNGGGGGSSWAGGGGVGGGAAASISTAAAATAIGSVEPRLRPPERVRVLLLHTVLLSRSWLSFVLFLFPGEA